MNTHVLFNLLNLLGKWIKLEACLIPVVLMLLIHV